VSRRTNVGNVGEFEQSLDGSVFAEGSVEYGEDDIDVDGGLTIAARSLKGHDGVGRRHGRHEDGFALGEHGSGRSGRWISGAQVLAAVGNELTLDQLFGMGVREPEALLGDADGNNFVLCAVDGLHDRCRR
jgi:hypothetical protein